MINVGLAQACSQIVQYEENETVNVYISVYSDNIYKLYDETEG